MSGQQWGEAPDYDFINCVTVDRLLTISEPEWCHLCDGSENHTIPCRTS